jgi:archaemetzincin
MNGSNSLNETDASPLHYCPDCLEKLSWNLGFEIPGHFKALLDFYTKYGFNEEAEFIEKNLRKLKQK